MAKGMKAKAVLVGLGIAAGTLFGAMAPAHADELSGTGIVGSYTLDELVHLTLACGGKHIPDATLITRSYTFDATALVGSYTPDAATAKGL